RQPQGARRGLAVELELRQSPDIAVHDQGPVIDPSETTAVFGRFYRAEGTQAIPGSGLGLAIVDDIITAHHGTVFAEPGPGARIGFRLPPISP
uniref:sensor histidine kinase n=1 Tax=Nocardia cyriacigeorgica TaxID=135487 RepID=UPI002456DA0C